MPFTAERVWTALNGAAPSPAVLDAAALAEDEAVSSPGAAANGAPRAADGAVSPSRSPARC
jgi:hypothetical protein